ncbi:MAG: glycosyltransferase family 4 protein, partial [Acidimicrobiales bacterium]
RVWTPLPPARSGVADHNMLLLPALAELADVDVVVDVVVDVGATPSLPAQVTAVRRATLGEEPADVSIYHLGNHHGLHRAIHDQLLADPGVVVLHDPSLADFYGAYHAGSVEAFDREVGFNEGPLPDGPPRVRIGTEWHLDRLALPMTRRVVDASLGVVVHSAWARHELTRRFPHKAVHHVELAAPVVNDPTAGAVLRRRLGWGDEHVVFGLAGGLWAHKRPELVVQIFAALLPLRPRARLLVAGREADAGATNRMAAAIEQAGAGDAVRVLTDVDDAEFTAAVSACDAIVDLRWPSAGETSATVMRAFGAGRPAIVSNLPQYAALDDRFCWRVPTDPVAAGAAALRVMLDVARVPGTARQAGRQAQQFVMESASPQRVAMRYVEVCRQAVELRRSIG